MTVVVTHTTPADSTFSSTGAAAWNANHALAGVGTMAEQDANNVAITGGTINNTTIGATTPSTGVFTTLTATGQTRLNTSSGSTSVGDTSTAGKFGVKLDSGFVLGNPWDSKTALFGNVNTASGAGSGALGLAFDTSNGATITAISPGVSWYPIRYVSSVHQFINQGVEQARITHTLSAVNYHQLTGSATGSGPIHSVAGSDTNIDLNLTTKGTGGLKVNNGAGQVFLASATGASPVNYVAVYGNTQSPEIRAEGSSSVLDLQYLSKSTGGHRFFTQGTSYAEQLRVSNTASAVNYVQVTGAATGGIPTISAQGSDSNVNLFLNAKGTGNVFLQIGGANVFQAAGSSTSVNRVLTQANNTGVAPVVQSVGSDTNIPLVLQPKGTGALQAQQTDSTATGGNARGANAVDWQTTRFTATNVASGAQSVIVGGYANSSVGTGCFVGSGYGNSAGGFVSVIGGGQNNSISSSTIYSGIVSGIANTASGYFNFVGGGSANSGTSVSAVTTQSATMNGTTAVTLSASNANIKVGQYISGTYAAGTYVAAISGTSLTLSSAASGSGTATLSFNTPHGVVVGGGNNTSTGSYSYIGGGGDAGNSANRNVASGDWSTVGGGRRNTASGAGSTVAGGGTSGPDVYPNTANGVLATISGGWNNTASGTFSVIAGGQSNTASGYGGAILGGSDNYATGNYSAVLGGTVGTTRVITGSVVIPAVQPFGGFGLGASQSALLVLGRVTTDATATRLTSDSTTTGNTTNQVIMPNNSAYFFTGEVVAGVTGGGNTKGWTIEGVIKRGANAASTALVGTPTVTSTYADAGASTWVIAVTADTTNGGLAVTFTGQASTTIRTVAQIRTTEMTY